MGDARWVQHISEQGKKWKVLLDNKSYFIVASSQDEPYNYFLPATEYVPCEPEARWVDVTTDCDTIEDLLYEQTETMGKRDVASVKSYYRLRKVHVFDNEGKNLLNRWAFIVERLVSHE